MLSKKHNGQLMPNLTLDPGTPVHHPGKSISGCKCILLAVSIFLLSGIGLFFFFFFERLIADVSQPHRVLYQNVTLEDMPNRAMVVQLLTSQTNI
jgi:hypothetical protein